MENQWNYKTLLEQRNFNCIQVKSLILRSVHVVVLGRYLLLVDHYLSPRVSSAQLSVPRYWHENMNFIILKFAFKLLGIILNWGIYLSYAKLPFLARLCLYYNKHWLSKFCIWCSKIGTVYVIISILSKLFRLKIYKL